MNIRKTITREKVDKREKRKRERVQFTYLGVKNLFSFPNLITAKRLNDSSSSS
jgi:hypothetical protein